MWFLFSLITLLCWSGSDLLSKIGCSSTEDKDTDSFSHLKMVTAVGFVMGIHALYQIFGNDIEINASVVVKYLPVSLLYISSMAVGYLGLRYIELSVSSPICNSSGAVVAVLSIAVYGISKEIPALSLVAVAMVCIGVIMLGIVEATEDEELRSIRQKESNRKYAKSFAALIIPVIYCLLDALGTFADSVILQSLDEDSANVAYELTFLFVGVISAIYTFLIRKQKFRIREEVPKYTAAIFETAGQFFYIYTMADTKHVMITAPVISGYCALSVLWSRIFLKEKLSGKHYLSLAFVFAGILILGILDI